MTLEAKNTIKNLLLFHDKNGLFEFNISNFKDIKIGIVQIELNCKDLYDIKVFKGSDYNNLFASVDDIYEDLLMSTLENILGT